MTIETPFRKLFFRESGVRPFLGQPQTSFHLIWRIVIGPLQMFPLKSNFKQRLRFWAFLTKDEWKRGFESGKLTTISMGETGSGGFHVFGSKKSSNWWKIHPAEKKCFGPVAAKKWDAKVLFEKHFLVRNCLVSTRDSFGSWEIASSKKVCYLLLFGRWSHANIKARSRSLLETTAPIGTLKLSRIEQHW